MIRSKNVKKAEFTLSLAKHVVQPPQRIKVFPFRKKLSCLLSFCLVPKQQKTKAIKLSAVFMLYCTTQVWLSLFYFWCLMNPLKEDNRYNLICSSSCFMTSLRALIVVYLNETVFVKNHCRDKTSLKCAIYFSCYGFDMF